MSYRDLTQNRITFQQLVNGVYGRRVTYVDYDTVSANNVLKIFAEGKTDFDFNKSAVRYLWNYKKGDQPILYRQKIVRDDIVNKVVENHAYEIVQYDVSTSYGEPIQYVCNSENENINKAVDKLNGYMKSAFKFQRNVQQGEWKSATGASFIAIQRTGNKNNPFRIVVPTPMNTFVIYSSYTGEPLLAVQELRDENDNFYYLCYSENHEYKIQNSKVIDDRLHVFGGIPIVEVPNNQDRLSDIEIIITLLDSINTMQSNRMDGIEQFIQSWIKFVNCEIDPKTFAEMKTEGALVVKSNNGSGNKADVDVMTQELNQTESQVAKDDLWNNALSILAIPNKQGSTGGDTQGAVELRNGWDFAKQRAKLKDAYIMEAEMRLASVVLNVLRVDCLDLGITTNDFDINIPHSPQDNMTVKANVLTLLLNAGIHPLIAIKVCGLWNDSEKVYLLSKPYLDVIYKKIDEAVAQIPNAEEEMKKAEKLVNEFNNSKEQALA